MMISKYSKTFCGTLIILGFLLAPIHTFASNDEKESIIEITDRYKEVKLGLTESTIYMVIDERIRSLVNSELQSQYEKDLRDFDDSEGSLIPSAHTFLSSNIIEIPFDNIRNIEFRNGTLRLNYSSNVPFQFEDVVSLNGNLALDNFYIEDLELLYQTAVSKS